MIQAALDSIDPVAGGVVYIPDGTHIIGPSDNAEPAADGDYSLQLADNVHLELGFSAVLKRRFTGSGLANATVRNKDAVPNGDWGNANIKVSGGTITRNGSGSQNEGMHLGFRKVDYLCVENVRFDGAYGDWNAEFQNCNDVIATNIVMKSTGDVNDGGLLISGGSRIAIANCNIDCENDALSLTVRPELSEENPASADITDVVISNCCLNSRSALVFRVQANEEATAAIRRMRASNIVAKSGVSPNGAGIVVFDETGGSPTRVSDIEVDGFWLDASDSPGRPVEVASAARVLMRRVVCWEPQSFIGINGSDDVDLIDCVVDFPEEEEGRPSVECVYVSSSAPCTNVRLAGGLYRRAKASAVVIGSTNHAVTGFEVSNVKIAGGLDGTAALRIRNGSGGLVSGNLITDNVGYGIEEVTPSNENVFIANRVSDNAEGLTFIGNSTEAIRNVAEAGSVVKDSGGFRQTIDGWNANGVDANEIEQPLVRTLGRFRAVRDGFVTGLIVTSTHDCTNGTLTVSILKNVDFAGDPGDPIIGLSA